MSDVQTSAERDRVDLTHFVYSTGSMGCLKTLSTVPVVAGDSFELNLVGAFRLSPFRRGLSVDSNVDIFTFYVPYRHSYGQSFVDIMKDGIPKSGSPVNLAVHAVKPASPTLDVDEGVSFLGSHYNHTSRAVPAYLYESYRRIYNHYFKIPYEGDVTLPLDQLADTVLRDGLRVSNLESMLTRPLNPNVQLESKFADMAGNDGIDIIGLNAAYGKLHTQQERDNFMQRYRDVMSSFGGSTHYDADQRPHLVMRTNFWASGYDVDGTSQESLGQFSGRVQQTFSHRVPRFYVPEHGVMMTVMCARFPPTHSHQMHPFVGLGPLNYTWIACDPALIANSPPVGVNTTSMIADVPTGLVMYYPHSQWYRYHPSHVDPRYVKLQGFPFFDRKPTLYDHMSWQYSEDYDQCFQTTQLGHWNVQSKMNCYVMRHIPAARDSIITN